MEKQEIVAGGVETRWLRGDKSNKIRQKKRSVDGEEIELCLESGEFFLGGGDDPLLGEVVVADGILIEVEEAERERVFLQGKREGSGNRRGVVIEGGVSVREGAGGDAGGVGEQTVSGGGIDEVVPASFHEVWAALPDSYEREAGVCLCADECII